jgi:hypothetical protein
MQKYRDREIPIDIVKEIKSLGYQKQIDAFDSHTENIEIWMGKIQDLCSKEDLVLYQRELCIAEGLYAEVAILYDSEYNCIRFTVNKSFETSFSLDVNRESSRFLSGLVAVTERNKIFYTIEQSAGYCEQDRAIRVILRDPLTRMKYLDIVFAEPHIVDVKNETNPLT